MKKLFLLGLIFGLSATFTQADDGDKKPQQNPAKNVSRDDIIKKYDKNGDGKLDKDEREAARKERQAERLKKYDKNGNGKLDEDERAIAREEFRKSREDQRQSKDVKRAK